MKGLLVWSAVGAALVATLPLASSVEAQGKSKAAPVCMTGKNKSGTSKEFVFYVARQHQTELKKMGFRPANCKFAKESFTLYRERICSFAKTLPDPAQRAFDNAHGITASKLCSLANEVTGV